MSESERPFLRQRLTARVVVYSILVLLLVLMWFGYCAPHARQSRSFVRRVVCGNNLHQIHQAFEQYAAGSDGQYPWETGVAGPRDAWRDLGVLHPALLDEPDVFICPGMPRRQRSESSGWFEAKQEGTPFAPSDTTNVISYSYCFDARDESRKPWTSNASATIRLLADKKAGITTTGDDLKKAAHEAKGRNVVYSDGHTEWVEGMDALDPDPKDDAVGKPDAKDYTDWWSDPPYYGE